MNRSRFISIIFAFVGAGLVDRGALALQSAGWLPGTIMAWSQGTQRSFAGNLLRILFGGRPSVLQVILFIATLVTMVYLSSDISPGSDNNGNDEVFAYVGGEGYNSRLYRLLRNPSMPRAIQLSMGIVFVVLLVVAITPINIGSLNNWGPLHVGRFVTVEDQNNLFNLLVWIVWLPLVSVSALIGSRLWCGNFCPLRLMCDVSRTVADRLFGKPRGTSPYMRVGWILPLNFILITLVVKAWYIQPFHRPSAFLFLGIFAVAGLVSMAFRRGTWCRYVCPIGGWLARIARMGVLAVRARKDVCATCRDKPCLKSRCPTFLNPSIIESNRYCLECWNCIKNCSEEKASLRVGIRLPGAELTSAPEPGEAMFIAGLVGMYAATARQETPPVYYHFVPVFVGLTLAGMIGYLVLSSLISWFGGVSWRGIFLKLGYGLLPLEFATALITFGDDAMSFLGITVPASVVLLGIGYTGSLVLSASILRHNVADKRRWGLAFAVMAVTLTLILVMWLNWYAGTYAALN